MTDTIPTLFGEVTTEGLPARPDPALDAYLDAASACIMRYGWSRTSPRDIAQMAGVERTTIYRNLGPKDNVFRLLIARDAHRIIDRTTEIVMAGEYGPQMVVELLASAVEQVLDNPVIGKLLVDEPDLIAGFLIDGVPEVIDRFTAWLAPVMEAGMQMGYLARRDPVVTTQWVVRMGLTLLVAPPPGDLRDFIAECITPVLQPDPTTTSD